MVLLFLWREGSWFSTGHGSRAGLDHRGPFPAAQDATIDSEIMVAVAS
ncbi:MAG: hypothetical protein ABW215_04005 [Kibdelosporangium sp.]